MLGRVLVAVQHPPTGGTDVGTDTQGLGDTLPTAATILAGVLRRDRNHALTGARRLEFKGGPKLRPARITDALGETRVPYHVADLQIFQIEPIVLVNELA